MLRSPRVLIAGRILAGLSQKELASQAKLALSSLQAIEQGTSDPRNLTLLALADALLAHGVRILTEDDRHLGGVMLERPTAAGPRSPSKARKAAAPPAPRVARGKDEEGR